MNPFKAYQIEQDENGKASGRMTTLPPEQLDEGEVTIRVHYSSINYKDALAATGKGRSFAAFPVSAASTWRVKSPRAPTRASSRATR